MKLIQKAFSNCKVDDLDSKGRVVVAANAFDNEDADGDISAVGSFQKTLKEHFNRARWFLNHDKSLLLGVPIEGSEAYPYLKMVGQLNMEKQIGKDAYSDYKLYAEHGKSLEHSIGVNPIKRDPKDRRIVKEWQLWEYSTLTSWGANPNTPMLGIKSAKDMEDVIDWMEIMLKKGDYTDERFKQIELQIKTLRSLALEPEPGATTQKNKPDEKMSKQLSVIKHFITTI
jgi:HK97 family phage prohead protease